MYFANDERKLSSYFEHIDGVYSIEDIPRAKTKKMKKSRSLKLTMNFR